MKYNLLVKNTKLGLEQNKRIVVQFDNPYKTGLIGYYKFDNNVVESINGYTGITNNISYSTGIKNNGINFANGDAYYEVGNASWFNFGNTDPFSIAFWMKKNEVSANRMFFHKMSALNGYRLEFNTSGQFLLYMGNFPTPSTLTITDTNWHQVVITYDGLHTDNSCNLYLDSIKEQISFVTTIGAISTATPLMIGNWYPDKSQSARSIFDEFAIFNRCLSITDVQNLYNNGQGYFY